MAEIGGITELQLLEAEIAVLEKQFAAVQNAGSTSEGCNRIVKSIRAAESKDGFLMVQGAQEHNQFHSSAGNQGGGGCCLVL